MKPFDLYAAHAQHPLITQEGRFVCRWGRVHPNCKQDGIFQAYLTRTSFVYCNALGEQMEWTPPWIQFSLNLSNEPWNSKTHNNDLFLAEVTAAPFTKDPGFKVTRLGYIAQQLMKVDDNYYWYYANGRNVLTKNDGTAADLQYDLFNLTHVEDVPVNEVWKEGYLDSSL